MKSNKEYVKEIEDFLKCGICYFKLNELKNRVNKIIFTSTKQLKEDEAIKIQNEILKRPVEGYGLWGFKSERTLEDVYMSTWKFNYTCD